MALLLLNNDYNYRLILTIQRLELDDGKENQTRNNERQGFHVQVPN